MNEWQWEITEKLEGSSLTVYHMTDDDGEVTVGVCSRNLELKENVENTFWGVVLRSDYDIPTKLRNLKRDIAIQGELIGPGIQGNIYKLTKFELYVYDVYDIREGRYLRPAERAELCKMLDLKHAPVIGFRTLRDTTVDSLLLEADGKSALNPNALREGLVYKCTEFDVSFKAVSNAYLLKHE